MTKQTAADIAATLESNFQKEQRRIAQEDARKKSEKEAAEKKAREDFEKRQKTVQFADATGGATGMLGTKATNENNKRFFEEKPPDERAEMTEADKRAEIKVRTSKDVEAYVDQIFDKYGLEEGGKYLNDVVYETINRTGLELELERSNKRLEDQEKFLDKTISVMKKQYWLGTGRLDYAQMEGNAKKMIGEKGDTRRSGLDKLVEDGAPQVELPPIPDDAQAYLAEMVTGMLGSIVQNSIAIGKGGSTLVAKATTEDPGQKVTDRVAAMMTADVAQHRDKVEKIRMLNEELRIKHQGDVLAAMVDFDNRAAADERAYNQMRFQAMGVEMANAYKILDMEVEAKNTLADISKFMDTQLNAYLQHEDKQDLYVKSFNANAANAARLEKAKQVRDQLALRDKVEYMRQKNLYVPYKDVLNNLPIMTGKGVSAATGSLDWIISMKPYVENNPVNVQNFAFGKNKGVEVNARIDRLPIPPEQKIIAKNNVLVAAQNLFTADNLTDDALTKLGSREIRMSPAGKEIESGGELMTLFTRRSDKEISYVLGLMDGSLRQMSAVAEIDRANYKMKMGAKQEPGNIGITSAGEE